MQYTSKIVLLNDKFMNTDTNSSERLKFPFALLSSALPGILFYAVDKNLGLNLFYSAWLAVCGFIFIVIISFFSKIRTILFLAAIYVIFLVGSSICENIYLGWHVYPLCARPIHLGDKKLDIFDPAEPLGAKWSTTIEIDSLPKMAVISGEFKDVDPDPINGPLIVLVNGIYIKHVNDFFIGVPVSEEHTIGPRNVEISVPIGLLRIGQNEISIEVLTTYDGLDDVNFGNLLFKIRK